jgi:hypothetical protein
VTTQLQLINIIIIVIILLNRNILHIYNYVIISRSPCARHQGMWWSGCSFPVITNLGSRWGWVRRFMSRPLYFRYPFCGPHSWSGYFGGQINLLRLPGIEPRFPKCPSTSLLTAPTTLVQSPNIVVIQEKWCQYSFSEDSNRKENRRSH